MADVQGHHVVGAGWEHPGGCKLHEGQRDTQVWGCERHEVQGHGRKHPVAASGCAQERVRIQPIRLERDGKSQRNVRQLNLCRPAGERGADGDPARELTAAGLPDEEGGQASEVQGVAERRDVAPTRWPAAVMGQTLRQERNSRNLRLRRRRLGELQDVPGICHPFTRVRHVLHHVDQLRVGAVLCGNPDHVRGDRGPGPGPGR